jgi:hypothetical protein
LLAGPYALPAPIHEPRLAQALALCQNESVRPDVHLIVRELLDRHLSSGKVDLNDIDEVIGTRAVSYDDVEEIITLLEAAGLRVGEPLDDEDIQVMRDILSSAQRLRESLCRPPTVAEISGASGHPPHAVRRALERGKSAARSR